MTYWKGYNEIMKGAGLDLTELQQSWEDLLGEFREQVQLQAGQVLVIGCSTSEILGKDIGKSSSLEVAEILLPSLQAYAGQAGIFLAVQGCEHINRALVVERGLAEKYNLEEVTVIPTLHAGGAMTTKAWQNFAEPLVVEQIQGHAGIDIGDTFIGMHLRPVAVPVRLSVQNLGNAHVTMARTRPRLIGGPRAAYPD